MESRIIRTAMICDRAAGTGRPGNTSRSRVKPASNEKPLPANFVVPHGRRSLASAVYLTEPSQIAILTISGKTSYPI